MMVMSRRVDGEDKLLEGMIPFLLTLPESRIVLSGHQALMELPRCREIK